MIWKENVYKNFIKKNVLKTWKIAGGLFASLTQPFRIASPFVAHCQVYKKVFFVIEFSEASTFQIIDPGSVLES